MFADLGDHLLRAGISPEDVVEQIMGLARLLVSARASVPAPAELETVDTQALEHPPSGQELVCDLGVSNDTGLEDPPLGTYFITEQRRSHFNRLHRWGSVLSGRLSVSL